MKLISNKTKAIVNTIPDVTLVNYEHILSTFLSEQDLRPTSRCLYERVLRLFFIWIKDNHLDINSLALSDVNAYKKNLAERKLSSLSIATYITAIKKFYNWAEARGIYYNIANGIKTPKRIQAFKKQHLTDDKSAELIAYFSELANSSKQSYYEAIGTRQEGKEYRAYCTALRNYAIVNLTLRSGLRTIEVIRADVGDITFKGGRRILKVWGKGRDIDYKDLEFVVLTDKTFAPISQYLSTRKAAKQDEPLFIGVSNRNQGERLTTRTISGICKEGLRAIGLDGREFTAHSLRHTTAVTILKHGGTLIDAQRLLRHTSTETTRIYTESIEQEERLMNAPEELFIENAF